MNREFVEAVRSNKLVGRGSCTSIDECLEDAELWDLIRNAKDAADAIHIAVEHEILYLERGLDQRWGEDDDPQLLAYRKFLAAVKGET